MADKKNKSGTKSSYKRKAVKDPKKIKRNVEIGEIVRWLLALFALFVFFGLRIAIRCPDRFGCLLAGGITCMIGIQTVLNVAVVTGSMPTTGLPLPFFSAGGTSVSVLMCAVAVLLNISRNRV